MTFRVAGLKDIQVICTEPKFFVYAYFVVVTLPRKKNFFLLLLFGRI